MTKIYSVIDNSLLFIHLDLHEQLNYTDRTDVVPEHYPVQLAICNFSKDVIISPHTHSSKLNDGLALHPTQECWIVINGFIEVTLYDIDKSFIKTLDLNPGDIFITFGGGH
jgi:hypothetical protein